MGLILKPKEINRGLGGIQKSLYYEPFKYSVIKKNQKYGRQKEYRVNFVQENISALAKNAPKNQRLMRIVVFCYMMFKPYFIRTAGTEQRTILLIKTFNSTGVTDWKEYTIPFNSHRQRLL